jgi:hypothetical protein
MSRPRPKIDLEAIIDPLDRFIAEGASEFMSPFLAPKSMADQAFGIWSDQNKV